MENNDTISKDFPLNGQGFIHTEYPDFIILNDSKKVKVKDLGVKFTAINSFFFDYLKEYHIPTAFVKNDKKNSMQYIKHERFPFSVKISNVVDKRTSKIFCKTEGCHLNLPIFELHYGEQNNCIVNESHLITFDLCTNEDLKLIYRICSKANAVLKSFFERRNETLAEVFCYFGKHEGKIYLIDDFTPKSLKIIPSEMANGKWIDPYNLTTSSEIRKYTDVLFNLTSV